MHSNKVFTLKNHTSNERYLVLKIHILTNEDGPYSVFVGENSEGNVATFKESEIMMIDAGYEIANAEMENQINQL
ncbi:hypothetical protein [Jiulongibacter sp. NS-SX5]|uniref:hypothetical protein n=1 Tax=Jiulongibacter sp. NS-SX5 TaxID=3463854 RepID=UPI004057DDC1